MGKYILHCMIVTYFFVILTGCGGGGSSAISTAVNQGATTVNSPDNVCTLSIPNNPSLIGVHVTLNSVTVGTYPSSVLSDHAISYKASFVKTGSQRSLPRPKQQETIDTNNLIYSAKIPYNLDLTHPIIYLQRSDTPTSYVLSGHFDNALRTVTALIPTTLLHQTLDGSELQGGDFTPVNSVTITVASAVPYAAIASSAVRASYIRSPISGTTGAWNYDDWASSSGDLTGKQVAVLVHGTFVSLDDLHQLADYLVNLGQKDITDQAPFFNAVLGFGYDSENADPTISGTALGIFVNDLINRHAQVYLFAHSQGGLVARWALEKGSAKNAVMLVMFGTPNEGIPAGAVEAIALAESDWEKPPFLAMEYDEILGNYSGFLKALNDTPEQSNADYYTVSGYVQDFGNANIDNQSLEYISHLFLNNGPSDGAVYVTSSEGNSKINWALHCRNGLPSTARDIITVAHSNLTHIGENTRTDEAIKLGDWIRAENSGSITITVN